MARVKVYTDRGWIEIPPPYTDIEVIEDKRFEITRIRGSVEFSSTNEYLSEYGEYMDEKKKGKWEYGGGLYECSKCHYLISRGYEEEYRFCPHCGADMRGEE